MDATDLDHLARALARSGSRRSLRVLAALPLLGGLCTLLDPDDAAAQGRRKRRKKAHKHGRGRRRKRHKHKQCMPNSLATICAEKCGQVQDNCQQTVDCGACACDPSCPPAITAFTASPATIDRAGAAPETATLTWDTTDATTCSIDHGVGSVSCNGSTSVAPDATTIYTLTASGASGGPVTAQATVTVQYCHPITTTLVACSTGATEFCLTEPIEATSSTHALAACETCYGAGECQELSGCSSSATWWQGPLPVNTTLAFQYALTGFAPAGDIVGGVPGVPPYATCFPTGSRWAP